MNELQITLLILAVIFIAGLYFLGQKRKQQRMPASDEPASPAQNVPKSHAPPEPTAPTANSGERIYEENGKLIIELDGEQPFEPVDPGETRSNFGRPTEASLRPAQQQDDKSTAGKEPQLFAIMVLGANTYDARTIRHALMAQGMVYDEKEQIFVLKNEEGRIYLRAANAWNPGTIPATDDDPEFKTPGIALILQLPTCVPAPAAMEDMIKLARKLSQRLRGHLYRMDRQQMTESDIRAMRQAALDYVSEPLK